MPWNSGGYMLRDCAISKKRDVVWAYRQDIDIYTQKTKSQLQSSDLQVDHVIECQLVNIAYNSAYYNYPRSFSNKRNRADLIIILNDSINLNVTSSDINQTKKGPFTQFLNRIDEQKNVSSISGKKPNFRIRSLAQIVQASQNKKLQQLVVFLVWDNIIQSMFESHLKIQLKLSKIPKYKPFSIQLKALFDLMFPKT
jgi:hypothetical protein